jgi:hypothetical protein
MDMAAVQPLRDQHDGCTISSYRGDKYSTVVKIDDEILSND